MMQWLTLLLKISLVLAKRNQKGEEPINNGDTIYKNLMAFKELLELSNEPEIQEFPSQMENSISTVDLPDLLEINLPKIPDSAVQIQPRGLQSDQPALTSTVSLADQADPETEPTETPEPPKAEPPGINHCYFCTSQSTDPLGIKPCKTNFSSKSNPVMPSYNGLCETSVIFKPNSVKNLYSGEILELSRNVALKLAVDGLVEDNLEVRDLVTTTEQPKLKEQNDFRPPWQDEYDQLFREKRDHQSSDSESEMPNNISPKLRTIQRGIRQIEYLQPTPKPEIYPQIICESFKIGLIKGDPWIENYAKKSFLAENMTGAGLALNR